MSTSQERFNNQPLPDYEPLFNQNADEVRKTPFKILTRILSTYWARLLFSMFMFVIKNLMPRMRFFLLIHYSISVRI